MNAFLALSVEVQLVTLFCLGAAVGGQVNRGIYRLAVTRQLWISPWSRAPKDAPTRRWYDRIPIIGWCALRREVFLHGRGFWIRPMLIEFAMALGFALHFWWEISCEKLIAPGFPNQYAIDLIPGCVSHLVLFSLMVVATFIDFDEKTIPDQITVYGVVVGCLFAVLWPTSLLPVTIPPVQIDFLKLSTPLPWPNSMNGLMGLIAGWGCFLGWFYAILPKIWWTRGGLVKAFRILIGGIRRYWNTWDVWLPVLAGPAAIFAVWCLGGPRWQALLSSLVGVAFGGGLIWAVRVIGSVAMRREAMGFGDVTLMAMIGAFVGWQPSLIVFFFAPLAGIVLAVAQWALTGQKDIPYGPFLSLAALVSVVLWPVVWDTAEKYFALGWVVPALVVVCLVLMHVMLTFWRILREV